MVKFVSLVGLSLALTACVSTEPAGFSGWGNDWPEGKDPSSTVRKLAELLLSTDAAKYCPKGYDSPSGYEVDGYAGYPIHYSVATLWVNLMECARLMGDAGLERALIGKFDPYLGEKAGDMPKFKHVDLTVDGAIPLEIAILNGDARAREMGLRYADLQWEKPKEDDPAPPYNATSFAERMDWWTRGYTDQTRLWIDDMYMITLLQGQAFKLTRDRKYVTRAAYEMSLYLDEIQVKDGPDRGLFYHGPKIPYVWGRGAGWMAAGMALLLEILPTDDPHHAKIGDAYRLMMSKLLERQCADGMWNQLVGDSTTWKETSCTAMFGYAFAAGVKNGRLDAATYAPAAKRAYLAVLERMDDAGNVADVCCGTGQRNSHEWYAERPRVKGDPHGQAALAWMCRVFLEK